MRSLVRHFCLCSMTGGNRLHMTRLEHSCGSLPLHNRPSLQKLRYMEFYNPVNTLHTVQSVHTWLDLLSRPDKKCYTHYYMNSYAGPSVYSRRIRGYRSLLSDSIYDLMRTYTNLHHPLNMRGWVWACWWACWWDPGHICLCLRCSYYCNSRLRSNSSRLLVSKLGLE
jgi:hypothetical protein